MNEKNVAAYTIAELKTLAQQGDPGTHTAVGTELLNRLLQGKLPSEPQVKTGLIHCYSIQEWDGGENHKHVFYLTSKTEAKRYLVDPRHKHNEAIPCVLKIFDTVEQSLEFTPKAIKERALAKLTEEEKFILNLK